MPPDARPPSPAAAPVLTGDTPDVGADPAAGRQAVCKKHGVQKRKYGNGWTCLKCASDRRRAREERLRGGKPPPGVRKSKPEMLREKMDIAALAGSGLAPYAIAKRLEIPQDRVEQVLRKDVKHDEVLRQLYRDAEAELAPKAFEAARKLIAQIDKVADGYDIVAGRDDEGNPIIAHVDTAPHHAAQALREMRPFIGMGDRRPGAEGGGSEGRPAATLQINSPEMLAAVVLALRGHREEQQAKAIEVAGERID